MKVVYYSSTSFSDTDFPLIREYQKKGIDVYFLIHLAPYNKRSTLIDIKTLINKPAILPASDYNEFDIYKDYIDLSKVYIINSIESSVKTWNNIKLTFQVYSFIKKIEPDIIHLLSPLDTFSSIMYRFRANMVLTMHDPFPHTGESNARRSFFRNIAMKLVPKFVLLNDIQKEDFKKVFHIKDEQILINKIGRFDYLDLWKEKTTKKNKHNVLFFGRISPYKGIEYLCQAMLKVKEQVPDATLTIAGGGKIYFDIAPYQKQDWVEVINRYVGMEELAGLLQHCALSVCPYTDATQSGVIMTSYSLCKPVVATNVGGLGEMVEDGKTGALVPPKNVAALSDAIIALLKDDAKRENMADNIRNDYFVGDKSWKVIAEKYIGFYKSLRENFSINK